MYKLTSTVLCPCHRPFPGLHPSCHLHRLFDHGRRLRHSRQNANPCRPCHRPSYFCLCPFHRIFCQRALATLAGSGCCSVASPCKPKTMRRKHAMYTNPETHRDTQSQRHTHRDAVQMLSTYRTHNTHTGEEMRHVPSAHIEVNVSWQDKKEEASRTVPFSNLSVRVLVRPPHGTVIINMFTIWLRAGAYLRVCIGSSLLPSSTHRHATAVILHNQDRQNIDEQRCACLSLRLTLEIAL